MGGYGSSAFKKKDASCAEVVNKEVNELCGKVFNL